MGSVTMRTDKALRIGVEVGGMMIVLMALVRLFGVPVRVELLLGSMFVAPGPWAWLLGAVLFLLGSGIVALGYAAVFEHLAQRADATTGVVTSLAHMVLSGALLSALPSVHPRVTETMASPGPYFAGLGLVGVLVFVSLHLTFGALVGGLYHEVRHPRLHRAAT